MPLPQNTLLQEGKYKIVRFISAGGFGCTYEAEHVMLHKRIAIKEFFVKDFCNRDETTLHVTVGTQSKVALVEKLKRKFQEEATALSRLNNRHIIHVTDVFEENGTVYYIMEYIDGKSIHDMLKNHGSIPEEQAVEYIRQVAQALKYIHAQNRLHLDIKPGNIMVDNYNKATLIDFGASKQYDEASGENTSTILGKTKGYAPIEQLANSVQTFTPATDIYSLGATLYKMLTGVTPPDANLLADEEALKPLPSSVSLKTRKAVEKALMIKRKDRPQTIDEFLSILDSSDIERVVTSNPIKDDEVTLLDSTSNHISQPDTQRGEESPRKREMKANVSSSKSSLILIVLLIIICFLGYALYFGDQNDAKQSLYSGMPIDNASSVIDKVEDPALVQTNQFENIKRGNSLHSVDIQWPVSLIGVEDITTIQTIIKQKAFPDEPQSYDIYTIADRQVNSTDDDVATSITVRFQQRLNDLCIFKISTVTDYSPGGGMGFFSNDAYLYYNTRTNKLLRMNDIISNNALALSAINNHIDLGTYQNKATRIPDEFILSSAGIQFIFPKYEIGYGYQDEVKIDVSYEELLGALSNIFLSTIGKQ